MERELAAAGEYEAPGGGLFISKPWQSTESGCRLALAHGAWQYCNANMANRDDLYFRVLAASNYLMRQSGRWPPDATVKDPAL